MKLPTCERHGPILGVPRTAGRDSGLSLARRARERGLSTSASMSLTTSLRSRNFPVLSTSAGFSLPALPYRASFISPPWKPPVAGNRHRARRSAANAVPPNAGGAASSILVATLATGAVKTERKRQQREIACDPLDFRLDKHISMPCLKDVTSSRFAAGRRLSSKTVYGRIRKIDGTSGAASHLRLDRGFMKMSSARVARRPSVLNPLFMLNFEKRKEPEYVIS